MALLLLLVNATTELTTRRIQMKINLKNYLLYLDRTRLGKGTCYMDDGFDESEEFLLINELIEPHLTELVF